MYLYKDIHNLKWWLSYMIIKFENCGRGWEEQKGGDRKQRANDEIVCGGAFCPT